MNVRRHLAALAAVFLFLLAGAPFVWARTSFPQEITDPAGKIVIYQPQPESLKGNVLTGRAAMSLQPKGRSEPIFGAFWFTSILDTDGETAMTLVRDIHVSKVRWTESKETDEARFTKIVEAAADRFVRATYLLDAIPAEASPKYISGSPQQKFQFQAAMSVLSVMCSVGTPLGFANEEQPWVSSTIWRTVSDSTNRVVMFDSALTPATFWVRLDDLDLKPGAPVKRGVRPRNSS